MRESTKTTIYVGLDVHKESIAVAQHARPNLFVVVKRKDDVSPAGSGKRSVRTGLTFDHPANPQEGRQHPASAGTGPGVHAALKEMLRKSGPASPCSRRSAITRSASA
jgi:hypothetical protein